MSYGVSESWGEIKISVVTPEIQRVLGFFKRDLGLLKNGYTIHWAFHRPEECREREVNEERKMMNDEGSLMEDH